MMLNKVLRFITLGIHYCSPLETMCCDGVIYNKNINNKIEKAEVKSILEQVSFLPSNRQVFYSSDSIMGYFYFLYRACIFVYDPYKLFKNSISCFLYGKKNLRKIYKYADRFLNSIIRTSIAGFLYFFQKSLIKKNKNKIDNLFTQILYNYIAGDLIQIPYSLYTYKVNPENPKAKKRTVNYYSTKKYYDILYLGFFIKKDKTSFKDFFKNIEPQVSKLIKLVLKSEMEDYFGSFKEYIIYARLISFCHLSIKTIVRCSIRNVIQSLITRIKNYREIEKFCIESFYIKGKKSSYNQHGVVIFYSVAKQKLEYKILPPCPQLLITKGHNFIYSSIFCFPIIPSNFQTVLDFLISFGLYTLLQLEDSSFSIKDNGCAVANENDEVDSQGGFPDFNFSSESLSKKKKPHMNNNERLNLKIHSLAKQTASLEDYDVASQSESQASSQIPSLFGLKNMGAVTFS